MNTGQVVSGIGGETLIAGTAVKGCRAYPAEALAMALPEQHRGITGLRAPLDRRSSSPS